MRSSSELYKDYFAQGSALQQFEKHGTGRPWYPTSWRHFNATDPLLILAAFLCPPLPVAILTGCSPDLFINVFLTFCGFLPGITHALYLILFPKARPEKVYIRDIKEKEANGPLVGKQSRKSDDTRVDKAEEIPKWKQ